MKWLVAVSIQDVKIVAQQRYSDALSLYGHTCLPLKAICEQTGVSFIIFSSHLSHLSGLYEKTKYPDNSGIE